MEEIKNIIKESIYVKEKILTDDSIIIKIEKSIEVILSSFQNKKRIWFCGNGGSASDAQHLAAEFSGRFYKDRKALPAEALHCNSSYLTAVANDYSFDDVYSRLVDGICENGDVLIGLSTSGNSGNIVKAFHIARSKGIFTIGFTGNSGGKLKEISDILINVPSNITPRIQESHIMIGHIICERVEQLFFIN